MREGRNEGELYGWQPLMDYVLLGGANDARPTLVPLKELGDGGTLLKDLSLEFYGICDYVICGM